MKPFRQYTKHIFGAILVIAILVLFAHLYIQPRFTSPSRASFIDFMLVRGEQANDLIIRDRKKLLILYGEFKNGRPLTPLSKEWLLYLAAEYNIANSDHPDFSKDTTWLDLLSRVDIVPNSLVIAQSIDESDWGQSRFAQDGNNYFGIWCYTLGCGITPTQKAAGQYYAVKEYSSALNSVEDYMNNLNSNSGYEQLRAVRQQLRNEGHPISGLALADTLIYYSQRRDAYVISIRTLIDRYNLAHYDDIATEQDNLLSVNGYLNSLKKPAAKATSKDDVHFINHHPRREMHPAHKHH